MSKQLSHPIVSFGVPIKALSYQVCESVVEIQAYLEECENQGVVVRVESHDGGCA